MPAPVSEPLRVACLGMGWWSDVLADAIQRSGKLKIDACYSRSEEKRAKFAAKYGCRAAPSYEEILDDPTIAAIINTTPNGTHLDTTREAAAAGKHVFLDKPIANTIAEARAITKACRDAKVVLALGYQRPCGDHVLHSGVPDRPPQPCPSRRIRRSTPLCQRRHPPRLHRGRRA